MTKITWKGRGEGEEDIDSIYGIYNYILTEKWLKDDEDILTFNDYKIDIFNEIKQQ